MPDAEEGHPAGSARELAAEIFVLVDALCSLELDGDAALLVQHARAAARRLHAQLDTAGDDSALQCRAAPGPPAAPGGSEPAVPERGASISWGRWTFPTEGRVVAPGLTVDIDGCCARLDGRLVHLSARHTRLLAAVAAHPGRVVPYGALALVGWNEVDTDRRSALHMQFSTLRSVLGLHASSCRLRAVTEVGYRLESDPRAPA